MANSKRRGVPASEAGLASECECHGEPMSWHKDARELAGGHWECRVRHREYVRRWRAAKKQQEAHRVAS